MFHDLFSFIFTDQAVNEFSHLKTLHLKIYTLNLMAMFTGNIALT